MNRRGEYLGYGPEAAELVGVPEPETFMQLPWDKRVARMFCTLFRNREERENPGAFLTADCRGNLRRIHEQFTENFGLHMRHGTEPEMMWLKKDESGQPNGGFSKPYCYHIDQFESLRPDLHEGHRIRPEDGARHDPGRPRGRARTDRAQLQLTTTRCARPTGSPPTGRSAARWRENSTSSPASCASRSWACRRTAATTTSRCGPAAPTNSSRSATTARTFRASSTIICTAGAARTRSCPTAATRRCRARPAFT